jgi:TonB family protein
LLKQAAELSDMITQLDFSGRPLLRSQTAHWSQSRSFLIALLVHTIVIGLLIRAQRTHMLHLGSGPSSGGIGAFITTGAPAGASAAQPVAKKAPAPVKAAKKVLPATEPTTQMAGSSDVAGAGAGQAGGGAGSGPVRLGAGGQGLSLLKRVEPAYPPAMQAARVQGTVVLDAVIHRDGTVGDIKVLRSAGPHFERAAIDAVKQWLYAPIPYEGILTVTVNFTLR